jgi:hypothetical protein
MSTNLRFTKEDVAKLSPELQETVARIALDDARVHRALLNDARSYFGYRWLPGLLAVVAVVLWWRSPDKQNVVPYLLIGLTALIQYHALGINSRIDAVLELLQKKSDKEGETRNTGLQG